MNVSELIRETRHAGALTQVALAEKGGTSQPTLAAYESGRAEPRLDTLSRLIDACGCELILSVRPRVRRGAVPIGQAADDVAGLLAEEGEASAWRRLLDLVDDFRGSPTAGKRWLVELAPALCGDRRFDAAIAALAEFLCAEAGLPYPTWTDERERFAEPWWFVSGLRGFEAMALRDSPIAFARHGVFVNEGAFERV
jgi:transcriptional regulator with XRE-family HTH domain